MGEVVRQGRAFDDVCGLNKAIGVEAAKRQKTACEHAGHLAWFECGRHSPLADIDCVTGEIGRWQVHMCVVHQEELFSELCIFEADPARVAERLVRGDAHRAVFGQLAVVEIKKRRERRVGQWVDAEGHVQAFGDC